MRSEFGKHKLAYVALILGLAGFILLFFAVWPNHLYQRLTVISMCSYYALWGVTTHLKSSLITKRVVYEYVGVATLACMVLLLITF